MGDMEGGGMQWRSAIHSDDGVLLHSFITLSSTPSLLTSTNLYPRHPLLSLSRIITLPVRQCTRLRGSTIQSLHPSLSLTLNGNPIFISYTSVLHRRVVME